MFWLGLSPTFVDYAAMLMINMQCNDILALFTLHDIEVVLKWGQISLLYEINGAIMDFFYIWYKSHPVNLTHCSIYLLDYEPILKLF